MLRPKAGRRLPDDLRPEAVARQAASLPDGLRDPSFPILLRRIEQAPILEGNRVGVFFQGDETFTAMLAAIDAAESEVLVESYIFKDDATGNALARALSGAAARGVAVKVLADAFGSVATRRAFWNSLRASGVEVRLFNPLFPHLFLQPFRDHRKLLVVDRSTAFTGGMNIGDEYGSSRRSRAGPWRDTHVRVAGPAAWEMTTVFSEAWGMAGGTLELAPLEPVSGGVPVLVVDSRPGRGHGETASVLAAIAAGARRRLWITNAYFAPRWRAVNLFAAAVERGVDVRVLLPGRTDVPLVRHAGHGYFSALLARGVRVYEYRAAILHAKSVVADDCVTLCGSTNLDFRSFHFNAECNLVILDDAVGARFSEAFQRDLERSAEVTREAWSRRRLLHKIGDALARRLGPVL
jgi:cardiolipin synthase A/B